MITRRAGAPAFSTGKGSTPRRSTSCEALALTDHWLDDEAIACLRELIRRWPDSPEAHNDLAALLDRRGQLDEAGALLRPALELEPSYPDARRNLESLTGHPARQRPIPQSCPPASTRILFIHPPRGLRRSASRKVSWPH